MHSFALFALFAIMLASCANKPPANKQQTKTVFVKETVHTRDTLKIKETITDSVFIKQTESFKALQKSIDSLVARRETEKAIDLLKSQVQYYNNLDQLGFRTLQLANLLRQTGREAEALAILESFAVYKPAINFWIDSANTLYDKISSVSKMEKSGKLDSSKLEVVNSLTTQIRNLKNANANIALITDLADSLRSIAPGDSVLAWLEKQLPHESEISDAFCEEQRKIAADKFANSRKNKTKAKALLTEAVDALDKCLAKKPSAKMREKVVQNRENIAKELKVAN
jgi:tetratricopeptide (TPR) repeat protein